MQSASASEWLSTRLYRRLALTYTKLLRVMATHECQKYLILAAVTSVQGVGITCFAIVTLMQPRVGFMSSAAQTVWLNIFLLTLSYFYSIKAIYDKRAQGKMITITIHALSFALFLQNILLIIWLDEKYKYIMQFALALHFLVIYYLLWLVLVSIAGVLFVIELCVRVLVWEWSSPCNSSVKLPVLFHPVLPALFNASMLIPERVFYSQEDSVKNCVVCLLPFDQGDLIKQLNCHSTHIFHSSCLQQWIDMKLTCPICRHSVVCVIQLDILN
eukprot:TRINITY_DN3468_c0_g1_i5.p1 TRINITY_DN3468_c0_g1~~TRINITY_DN3468_c0_g1_i5.p1  ORF type:complete len:272 (+),score=25.43 TRINITY_DN3468_c0_g1_i5:45-860(+)